MMFQRMCGNSGTIRSRKAVSSNSRRMKRVKMMIDEINLIFKNDLI